MTGPELLALETAMPILDAEIELKGEVPDNRIYDVVLVATGDEEVASSALTHRIEQRHRRDEQPDI